jgi:hypothetical protein
MKIRRANDRGYADHGWLKSFHTFSFADYYDPNAMGFRALRVINEDRVAPGQGFPTHPHRDMEIVSYVLAGGLEHKDSMGTGSVIRPGDVQRMSAGTGVTHSEFNASKTEPVHFLQIWILPDAKGHAPGYEQKRFEEEEKRGRLRLVASSDGRDGSVKLNRDVALFAGLFDADESATYEVKPGRHLYVHLAKGSLKVGDAELAAGDAVMLDEAGAVKLSGGQGAEVLVFDLS